MKEVDKIKNRRIISSKFSTNDELLNLKIRFPITAMMRLINDMPPCEKPSIIKDENLVYGLYWVNEEDTINLYSYNGKWRLVLTDILPSTVELLNDL